MTDRFWDKVDKSGDCWVWRGVSGNGYGQFWNNGKNVGAHRFAYSLANGPIPNGLFVCHHCDNPKCVRPSHLFLGTNSDNIVDSVVKGRWTDNRGEKHGMSKLVKDDVREIRRLYSLGVTQTVLAKAWEVDQSTISYIVNGKRWKHELEME